MVWCKFGAKKKNTKKIWQLSGSYLFLRKISFKFVMQVCYLRQTHCCASAAKKTRHRTQMYYLREQQSSIKQSSIFQPIL